MTPEAAATLLGAIIGVVGTVIGSVITWALSQLSSNRRAVRGARVALAREIIRYRGDQARVTAALNEIPVVFGHDAELLRLYRAFLDGTTRKDETLLDIVVHVSKVAGIRKNVTTSDLKGYLSVVP